MAASKNSFFLLLLLCYKNETKGYNGQGVIVNLVFILEGWRDRKGIYK